MKTSLRLFFVLAGLPLMNATAQPSDVERDIVRSVVYDSHPEYIEAELERFVERIASLLSEHHIETPEQNFAAYVAVVAILDEVQRRAQEAAPTKPRNDNNWSDQVPTGWHRARRMTRDALPNVAYFSDMSAREAVASLLERELAFRWLEAKQMATYSYVREATAVTYGKERETLFHRFVEQHALYFLQNHARQFFEVAYSAALRDLKEEDGAHPFHSTKSLKWFRDKYLSDFAAGASPFITILLCMFESRVWK